MTSKGRCVFMKAREKMSDVPQWTRVAPQWTCVVHLAPNINIRCARVARSTLSKFLPLTHFRSSTLPMPGASRHLRSAPSTSLPLEHAVASTASPSMPLDRFTLDLDSFARSTSPPPALEHVIDLDCFTDAPNRALHRRPRPHALLDYVLPLITGNPRGTCELL
jgi:hypothetical protein